MDHSKMKTGIELIAEERTRQINVENWTANHDDKHNNRGQLLQAAMAYQMVTDAITSRIKLPKCFIPRFWPWSRNWWKPSQDRIRNLAKAGALIAAEIDRLQREQNRRA